MGHHKRRNNMFWANYIVSPSTIYSARNKWKLHQNRDGVLQHTVFVDDSGVMAKMDTLADILKDIAIDANKYGAFYVNSYLMERWETGFYCQYIQHRVFLHSHHWYRLWRLW